jgi:hypothetical protein
MRRYMDSVEVRRDRNVPHQFLWRGRLWLVRAVLAHWVETGEWWRLESDDLLAEREVWRVEAGRGLAEGPGIFELSFDWACGEWSLVGCVD